MNTHLMIDFETLGQRPDCALLSLGAVVFNRERVLATKSWAFARAPQLALGRTIQDDTLAWWGKQGEEARKVFALAETSGVDLGVWAHEFNLWLMPMASNLRAWSCGANFDLVIAENALGMVKRPTPWKFWNTRCYRTLKAIAPGFEIVVPKVKHDALEDALAQAENVRIYLAANPRADG